MIELKKDIIKAYKDIETFPPHITRVIEGGKVFSTTTQKQRNHEYSIKKCHHDERKANGRSTRPMACQRNEA